jgi:hypothetical protein
VGYEIIQQGKSVDKCHTSKTNNHLVCNTTNLSDSISLLCLFFVEAAKNKAYRAKGCANSCITAKYEEINFVRLEPGEHKTVYQRAEFSFK